MAKTARNVRVPDELWAAAKAKAAAEYRTVTDVIVQALRGYTGQPEREQPAADFEERETECAVTPAPQPEHPAFTAAPARPRKPEAEPAAAPYPCCAHCKHGGRRTGHDSPCPQC